MEYEMTQTRRSPLQLLEDNFRRPTGSAGRFVGHLMAVQHRTLTLWTIGHMGVPPTDRVLDVGCGGGMAIKLLAGRARDGFVAGLDYSPEMVDQAARRNAAAVRRGAGGGRHGDAVGLPYGDESFDQVCAIETFYFWPDPLRGLAQAYRVLRPGGQITVALEMSREAAAEPTLFQRYFGKRFTERSAQDGLTILSGAELTAML